VILYVKINRRKHNYLLFFLFPSLAIRPHKNNTVKSPHNTSKKSRRVAGFKFINNLLTIKKSDSRLPRCFYHQLTNVSENAERLLRKLASALFSNIHPH